jgi:hypothetical protein
MAKERGGSPASVEGMQDSGLEKRKRAAMKGSTSKVMAILLTLHLELCRTNNLGLCVLQSFRWSASNVKSIGMSSKETMRWDWTGLTLVDHDNTPVDGTSFLPPPMLML